MAERVATSPSSPVAKKPEVAGTLMDFFTALRKVADGEKITKVEWGDPKIFGVLQGGSLVLFGGIPADGKFHPWKITDGDLVGEDWKVV